MAAFYCHLNICIILIVVSLTQALPNIRVPKACVGHCANDGICVILSDTPACYCLPEWEGERCEAAREYWPNDETEYLEMSQNKARYDECRYVPRLCSNGGLCKYENSTFSCICPFTHIGPRCETLSPCIDFCKNGGVCKLFDGVSSTCNCTGTNFRGTQCNVPETSPPPGSVSTTTPHPLCNAYKEFCNGGGCSMASGMPRCDCPSTRTGEYCEIEVGGTTSRPSGGIVTNPPTVPPGGIVTNPPTVPPGVVVTGAPGVNCASSPCKNGRPCYNNGNSYLCYCGTQYAGYNCEVMVGK